LSYQKGFDVLIKAHATLSQRGLRGQLVILGEGEWRQRLAELAVSLGVADTVKLPGFLVNPYPLFQRAHVFALPSRVEGFGLVLVEALALGIPIVASNCPAGPAEILAGGKHGLLVPPDNVSALADAIGQLLTDRDLRKRLSDTAMGRALAFSPEVVAQRWATLLRDLA
jgi:glycosyltransferase involved in cell wall biosynthesis